MLRIREIDHLVLRVYDVERMRRFYCEVLGAEHVAWRPEFGMSHLRVGRSMVDLITIEGPLGKPGGPSIVMRSTISAFASSPSTRRRSSRT